jgi:hypothetical protein
MKRDTEQQPEIVSTKIICYSLRVARGVYGRIDDPAAANLEPIEIAKQLFSQANTLCLQRELTKYPDEPIALLKCLKETTSERRMIFRDVVVQKFCYGDIAPAPQARKEKTNT